MVTEALWIKKVQEFCELANTSTKSNGPTAAAIFRKIEFNYTDDDMLRAVDEMIDSEIKLTWPISRRYFEKFRSIRLDSEAQRRRMKDRTDVEFLKMTHPEIQELIESVIDKRGWKDEGQEHLAANATVVMPDGKVEQVWIDMADANMQIGKAITIIYAQRGEQTVRTQHIRLGMVGHKLLSKRTDGPPAKRGPQSMFSPKHDDDFIPELELPDAIQDSFEMDGSAGGHA